MNNQEIHIYLFHIEELGDAASFDAASLKVDEVRKEKVKQIKLESEKRRTIGAGLLLQYAIAQKDKQEFPTLVEIVALKQLLELPEVIPYTCRLGEMGKPYFIEYPELYFSLSHSGDYVALGISKRELGVDIQLHGKDVKKALAEKVLTEEELNKFKQLDGKEKADFFYRCWTIKESYCKLTGKGLSEGMKGIVIHFTEGSIYKDSLPRAEFIEPDLKELELKELELKELELKEWIVDGYSMSVCI